jgi:XTP/dITP diphosphohydrolase
MATKQLVLASQNRKKLQELQRLLEGTGIEVLSLPADAPEVEETGTTFEANALLKARAAVALTGLPALADDSGLAVDALNGEPGVRSARWVPGTDEDRYRALLVRMEGIPADQRTARFVSVVAVVTTDGHEEVVRGECIGQIGFGPKGTGGFGYDPIFFLPDGRSMAELSMAEKNQISHRARALAQIVPRLPHILGGEA